LIGANQGETAGLMTLPSERERLVVINGVYECQKKSRGRVDGIKGVRASIYTGREMARANEVSPRYLFFVNIYRVRKCVVDPHTGL
jgi:hypothetical protein